ncbi:pantothenate kinase, putative [Plasmodium gallinaceum]|uniref:Pantothenate kinase, putative n=1 Tax=Plasmodium gallinaceum TaxID=5849 RepID=A0A1J1GTM0_PLAGA|nr:pantothenate kinase, putative [Plasmodium gallinaceum]CRG95878.1 pantothenate kinase, putative [Plasmodium gallinaceum]
MGNTLGIDCSFNYVHVTNILINDRNKKKTFIEIKNKCNTCSHNRNVLEYDNTKDLYSLSNSYKLELKKNEDDIEKKYFSLGTNIINRDHSENQIKESLYVIEDNKEIFNETLENNGESDDTKYFSEEIRKKKEKESVIYKNRSDNKIMENYINNKEKISNENSSNFLKEIERKKESHNSTNNEFCKDYVIMQKDIFEYIMDVQNIIEDTVQLIILKREIEKSQSSQFSLRELSEHFKENEDLYKKFHIYKNFIKNNMSSELENDEKNENNDEIAQIYFWTLKIKRIDQAILKYSKCIKNILINITGKNSNYVKKKFMELKKMNNIYYHKEIKCINSSICFLKHFYPKGLYHFISSRTSNVENASVSSQEEIMLKKHFLNKKEVTEISPYIIVNIKRGITYHLINEENLIKRIGGCLIGCKSIIGLFFLITKKLCSLEMICKLAQNGVSKTFDMTVEDIYGSPYSAVGLRGDIIASFFGKAQNINYINNSIDSSRKEIYSNLKEDILDNQEHVSSFEYLSFESSESDENDDNWYSHIFSKSKNNYSTYINSRKNMLKENLFNFHSDSLCNYTSVSIKEKKLLQKEKKRNYMKNIYEDNYLIKETADNQKSSDFKNNIYKYESDDDNYKKEIKNYRGRNSDNNIIMRNAIEKNNKENLHIFVNKKKENIFLKKSSSDSNLNVKKGNDINKNTSKFMYKNKNKKLNNFLKIDSEKIKNHYDEEITNITKFNTNECDIAKSLLSMVIFTIVHLSYFHSHMCNVKSIIFSGLLLDNSVCLSLVKIIINFMSHNTQKLYFSKFSKHLGSLGSALHLIDLDNLFLKCK